jgi:ribose transport system permease protein
MSVSEKTHTGEKITEGTSFADRFWKVWRRYGIFIILLAFILVLSILTPRFLTVPNLLNVARQVSVLSIISLGLLVVIITGNVDLTVGAWMGLAGALMASWSKQFGILPAIILAFGAALLVGLTNGFLTTRGKGLSVIVTLAMFTIFQGITLLVTGGRPVIGFPESIRVLGTGYLGPIPIPVVIAILVAILIHVVLRFTAFGRELYAIGGNPEAARLSGIPNNLRVISAFIISAACAALAGLVLIARVSSAQPTAGVGEEMNAVGAVLIGGASLSGGAGNVLGTLAGVLILGIISNGLNLLHVDPYYQYVVKGLIILFAILMDQWGRK